MITVLEIWEEFEEHHIYVFEGDIPDEKLEPFIRQHCKDYGWNYEEGNKENWYYEIIQTEFSKISS